MTEALLQGLIKLKINANQLKVFVAKAFKKIIDKALKRSLNDIKFGVATEIVLAIRNSPEFIALVNGSSSPDTDFEAQFGTTDMQLAMDEVIDIIASQVEVKFQTALAGQGKITGGIVLRMIEGDFEKVSNVPHGSYISKPSSSEVPWLRWILIAGSTTIDNFGILFDLSPREQHASRTGRAIMVSLNTSRGEQLSHWTVPNMFQGDDINSNFITRAITKPNVINKIERIIQDSINRRL